MLSDVPKTFSLFDVPLPLVVLSSSLSSAPWADLASHIQPLSHVRNGYTCISFEPGIQVSTKANHTLRTTLPMSSEVLLTKVKAAIFSRSFFCTSAVYLSSPAPLVVIRRLTASLFPNFRPHAAQRSGVVLRVMQI